MLENKKWEIERSEDRGFGGTAPMKEKDRNGSRGRVGLSYLVQRAVSSALDDLNDSPLASETGGDFEIGETECAQALFGHDGEKVGPVEGGFGVGCGAEEPVCLRVGGG
jgi:hypothetical protein